MSKHLDNRQQKVTLLQRISKGQAGLKDLFPPSNQSFYYDATQPGMVSLHNGSGWLTFDEAARLINTPNCLTWLHVDVVESDPRNRIKELTNKITSHLAHVIVFFLQDGNTPLDTDD